ncbi:MAG: hypothetical protein ACF8K1_04580 [Phycisphaerales bacterium JB047]
MHISWIIALFSRVPHNTLSDAVPFSIARSYADDEIIAYTTTGPKVERTRSYAFWLLGIPWLIGGFMLLVTPNPNTTAPLWIVYTILLGVGSLACYQGFTRHRAATARVQAEIHRQDQTVIIKSTKPHAATPPIEAITLRIDSPIQNGRQLAYVTIADTTEQPLMVLGAFKHTENADICAQLISEESCLPLTHASDEVRLFMHNTMRLIPSDKRALEKPIATKPLKPSTRPNA